MRRFLPLLALAACAPEALPERAPMVFSRTDELRPTDTNVSQMWKYDSSETIEHFDSPDGGFRVHFSRAGRNAVPDADVDSSSVPDFVEDVARVYDDVGQTYASWGFRRPPSDALVANNGGDGRYDVYLLDFARAADGAMRIDSCPGGEVCISYVNQENDFAGYGYPSLHAATVILGSHEYFHGVQAAYDNAQDVVVSEGTAVWATEHFDPSSNDFENFLGGYFSRPDRSLDSPPPGPVPAFAYGSAIFFEYLSERFGPSIVRELWEHLENGHGDPSEPDNQSNPTWVIQLDALLKTSHQSSFAEAFHEFALWNLYTGSAANGAKAYAHATAYPSVASTTVAAPYSVNPLRVFYASTQYLKVPTGGRAAMTAALVDDPATAEDETSGMAVVMVARNSGTISSNNTDGGTLDTSSASELIVGVVNTNRGPRGAALTQKPAVCIGSPAEVDACVALIRPPLPVDSGVPDAGAPMSPADAGTSSAALPDGGTEGPAAPTCGCSTSPAGLWFALLVLALTRRSRSR